MRTKILYTVIGLFLTSTIIAQEKYVNPLERWATHNIEELNTFATGDPITAKGKLYQFGRNVPLTSEGNVLYWANIKGPYVDGSPANYRVWHIHYLNNFNNTGNWFGTGTTNDSWKSIVVQTVTGGSPPSGTFEGYDYTVSDYYGTNNGSPAPKGWHIPTYSEMKALFPFIGLSDLKIDFSPDYTKNDIEETSIDIMGDGISHNYLADYMGKSTTEVIALRFKGSVHETAFRYQYITLEGQIALKISAKSSGGKTISEITKWEDINWNDAVIRYFPAVGFRTTTVSPNPNNIQNPTKGYYWCAQPAFAGNAYYYTFSNSYVRGDMFERSNACAIRCVKDVDRPITGFEIPFDINGSDNRLFLKCNSYTDQEVEILNKEFDHAIESAPTTRGKVTAAAIFMVGLNFSVPYAYEVTTPGYELVARYTRKGFFLRSFEENGYSHPAWGCNVMRVPNSHPAVKNLSDIYANGLHCSSFVSWCLYNGGAAEASMLNKIFASQYRNFPGSTEISLAQGAMLIEPGDLLWFEGHVAIVIGIIKDKVIFAESAIWGNDHLDARNGTRWRIFDRKTTNYSTFRFKSLIQMERVYNKETTSSTISNNTPSIKVYSSGNGKLHLSGHDLVNKTISVDDMSGVTLFRTKAASNEVTITLSKGLYIVNLGTEKRKVFIN